MRHHHKQEGQSESVALARQHSRQSRHAHAPMHLIKKAPGLGRPMNAVKGNKQSGRSRISMGRCCPPQMHSLLCSVEALRHESCCQQLPHA